jgi:hypothetical protein
MADPNDALAEAYKVQAAECAVIEAAKVWRSQWHEHDSLSGIETVLYEAVEALEAAEGET